MIKTLVQLKKKERKSSRQGLRSLVKKVLTLKYSIKFSETACAIYVIFEDL